MKTYGALKRRRFDLLIAAVACLWTPAPARAASVGRIGRAIALGASLASLALAGPASGAGSERAEVQATGNPFTGGLGYDPRAITVEVGTIVRWTNTDSLAPHTATERNGLWDLGGDYGLPGLTGFGPGESVERSFEASSFTYYCTLHGFEAQNGSVAVPVELTTRKRTVRRRARLRRPKRPVRRRPGRRKTQIIARWASEAPAKGRVFDVELRRGNGPWRPLRSGTAETSATLAARRRGTVTTVRARLRSASSPEAAADWSPEASVAAP